MPNDIDVIAVDGRVLVYGVEADDHLDLEHRTYEVNRRLPVEHLLRLCFNAGFKAARSSRIPLLASNET